MLYYRKPEKKAGAWSGGERDVSEGGNLKSVWIYMFEIWFCHPLTKALTPIIVVSFSVFSSVK